MEKILAQLLDLDGQVAIVTGGAQGIGKGISTVLASAGAHVFIADKNTKEAEKTATELGGNGAKVSTVAVDLSDESSIRNMVKEVATRAKRLDILVNNAAIYPFCPIREMSSEVWDKTLAVDLRAPFLTTRYAAEQMITDKIRGRIVNISSINTYKTYVGMAHYDSSKGGIEALTKSAALEYAPFGITANAVAPGGVKTPGSLKIRERFAQGGDVEKADTEMEKKIPLGRWARPEEIGYAVWYFCSAVGEYVTGQVIYVDGGMKLGL